MAKRRSSLGTAVALTVSAALVLVVLGTLSESRWAGAEGRADRLVPVLVAAGVLAVAVASHPGLRRDVLSRPARAGLSPLWVLVALAVLPLVGGWSTPAGVGVLVVGYLATGLWEEGFYRGVLFRVLRPWGASGTAWWTAALFGLSHLTNVVFGQAWALSAAQAVGAFCFGVGYGAVRLRLAAVWPLMLAHAASDLFMQASALPGAAWWAMMIGRDVVLLALGVVLLADLWPSRKPWGWTRREESAHLPTGGH
ncbi:MAG: CPBP family intramembrane glutamic endopeptidase [Dermatophilaceae bacterium]